MKEIRQIAALLKNPENANQKYALATVVFVEGSSYRKPGARMLISEKGNSIGAISGGCLEEDVVRKAIFVIMKNEPQLLVYQTTDDEEATNAYRLGCNGTIYVLIEPVVPGQKNETIEALMEVAFQTEPSVLCTTFSVDKLEPGQVALFQNKNTSIPESTSFSQGILPHVKAVFDNQRSAFEELEFDGKRKNVFLEFIQPVITINIFGAGYDVLPLIEMVKILGWKINIITKRPKVLNIKGINQKAIPHPEDIFNTLNINNRSAFVLMSHNYDYDKIILRELLDHEIPYIGMLGPKNKIGKFIREFKAEGITHSDEKFSKIHSPIGLDIGAESAEEIALAIVAQIKAVFSGKLD